MSQEAAAALETVLQDLKAKRDDQQQKLDAANAVIASIKADEPRLRAEALKALADAQTLEKSTNPADLKRGAEIAAAASKKLEDAVASINAASENGRLNRENLILLNKSITSTEEKISAEKASAGQVSPTPVDPAVAPAVSNTQSFVTTAATVAVPAAILTAAPVVAPAPPAIPQFIGAEVLPPVPVEAPKPIDPNTLGELGINTDQIPPDQTAAETARLLRPVQQTSTRGLTNNARSQAVKAAQQSQWIEEDWRVRLSLAPNSNYLYNVPNGKDTAPGILAPLKTTNGVIFPYTPAIQVSYAASYPDQRLIHTNYKIFQYQGSSVDQVTISCDFTAQDTSEANYLLAVIHFFRSLTKMFYGQDQNPNPGVPPPMCFLSGLGEFQFNKHPLVVSQFTYDLPTDVDYIRASSTTALAGVSMNNYAIPKSSVNSASFTRKENNRVPTGGKPFQPVFATPANYLINAKPTYVPTKMKMMITCIPIVTRNDISTKFSLRDYANGKLIQGGIW